VDRHLFSLYDFFSYLSAGTVWLISLDLIFDKRWIFGKHLSIAELIFFLVISYVIGHTNSHLASGLLEKRLVGALGYPSVNLFVPRKRINKLFEGFQEPLPQDFANQVISRYKLDTGKDKPGESMFLYCFHIVKEQCPKSYTRLETLLSLYGLARNISSCLFPIGIIAVITGSINRSQVILIVLGLVLFVGSYVMLLRYLKFYRHYSIEVFSFYLTTKSPNCCP